MTRTKDSAEQTVPGRGADEVAVADCVSEKAVEQVEPDVVTGHRRRRSRRIRRLPAAWADRVENWPGRWKYTVFISVVALAVALSVAVAVLGMRIHSDSALHAMRAEARAAADAAVPKLLTYRADTVETDMKSAAELLTGDFKREFESLAAQTIIPSAQQNRTSTEATVAANSVVSAADEAVTVLMFINQSTTSEAAPEPKLDASRVRVEMAKVQGRWLVSALQPV